MFTPIEDAVTTPNSSSSKFKLTQRGVDWVIANHPPKTRKRYWFADPPGLYLLITPNGCASYCLRFNKLAGGKGDYAIGRADKITPEMARRAATERNAALTLSGTDPVEARRAARTAAQERKVHTFEALSQAFMSARENRKLSPRTNDMRQWALDKHILPRIGSVPVADLKRSNVKQCVRDIQASVESKAPPGPSETVGHRAANMCHGLIRRVFNWAMSEDGCEYNPATFPKMFDDTPVKRIGVLNDARLRALWVALEAEAARGWGTATAIACQLSFLTLQRPNEIVSAHQGDFDWDEKLWRIPESRTKTNTVYEVPLTAEAVTLFQRAFALSKSPWAFPADSRKGPLSPNALSHRFAKTRRRLLAAKQLPSANVQLYDGRRYGRTRLVQGLGFPAHIAEMVINHAPDHSMATRYDVADHGPEIRRACEAWAGELKRIVSGEPPASSATVIPMVFQEAAE